MKEWNNLSLWLGLTLGMLGSSWVFAYPPTLEELENEFNSYLPASPVVINNLFKFFFPCMQYVLEVDPARWDRDPRYLPEDTPYVLNDRRLLLRFEPHPQDGIKTFVLRMVYPATGIREVFLFEPIQGHIGKYREETSVGQPENAFEIKIRELPAPKKEDGDKEEPRGEEQKRVTATQKPIDTQMLVTATQKPIMDVRIKNETVVQQGRFVIAIKNYFVCKQFE